MATKKLFYVNVTSPEGTSTYYARDDLWRLELSPERLDIVENVVAAIASYLSEVAKLVASSDKLASSLPSHLSEPGLVIVTCTPEGIIVRYDKQQIDEVVGTWSDSDLKTIVPHISENYVHCIASGEELDANTPMLELRSVIVDSDGQSREIGGVKTGLIVELPLRERPTLMNRPNRSVQVSDTLMIEMHGVAVDTGTPEKDWDKGQPFIAKSSVRLPLKWNALEIYLPYQSESWELDQTPQWALQEILLFQSIRNLDEVRNHAIDPLFTARNHFIQLLSEFDEVLESAENEEQIQVFLTSHPELLEPAFKKVWPKFTLGPYVTDYVFEGAMGDYLLVELEHSSKQLFIKNGNQSAPLTQAIGQTVDWVRFIEDLVRIQSDSW